MKWVLPKLSFCILNKFLLVSRLTTSSFEFHYFSHIFGKLISNFTIVFIIRFYRSSLHFFHLSSHFFCFFHLRYRFNPLWYIFLSQLTLYHLSAVTPWEWQPAFVTLTMYLIFSCLRHSSCWAKTLKWLWMLKKWYR